MLLEEKVKIKDAVKIIQDLQREFEELRSSLDKVVEQTASEKKTIETPSSNQSEQFHDKNEALQREVDDLRKQLELQRAQQKEMRDQIRRGIYDCIKDVFTAINEQNPFDRAEQLHRDLTSAREVISKLQAERNELKGEIESLQKNNIAQQQTIQGQRDRIESDTKSLEVERAKVESAQIEAQKKFVQSLVESVGVRQLSQLLQSYGRNSENPSRTVETAEEQIGRKVVTFLAQQKLQLLHLPNQLIRLRSESDLAQYELPSHTRFSTEQLLVVAIPGIVWKNTVLAKAKLREWDEEDDKERTQPTSETPIPEPGETAKDRDGTLRSGGISSAESGADITEIRSEEPEGKS